MFSACVLVVLAAEVRFEVASVKPVEVQDVRAAAVMDRARATMPRSGGLPMRGRRVEMRGYTLGQLIAAAFGVRPRQVSGPSWLAEKRFDVEALLPPDAPFDQGPEMLQALLRERFGLKAHRASREDAGYAMTVAKGGPEFRTSAPRPPGAPPPTPESLMDRPRRAVAPGASHYEYRYCTMEQLAVNLGGLLEAPVENRTELTGRYDVVLAIPPPLDPEDRDVRARVLDAVKGLGLSLKAGRISVPVVVADSVEKTPTQN